MTQKILNTYPGVSLSAQIKTEFFQTNAWGKIRVASLTSLLFKRTRIPYAHNRPTAYTQLCAVPCLNVKKEPKAECIRFPKTLPCLKGLFNRCALHSGSVFAVARLSDILHGNYRLLLPFRSAHRNLPLHRTSSPVSIL